MTVKLLPIGAWCRTAYQARRFAETDARFSCASAPFDWTITPYSSLQKVLSQEFDARETLGNKATNSVSGGELFGLNLHELFEGWAA
jgi:hypothetical protein